MKRIWVIAQKEITDHLRDYRSWTTGIFWALFGPLLLGALILMIGNSIRESSREPLRLPVAGAEHAPNLVAFLQQQQVIIAAAPADPIAAVRTGDINVALIIPPEYSEQFTTGRTARVQLIFDSTRQAAQSDIRQTTRLLQSYSEYLGMIRLSLRGISPEVVRAVQIEERDTATPQSQALIFVSMLPYFIIFAIFNGAAPLITDATAGERERGSLEPLLINPLPRGWFAIGKMLAATPFATLNLVITLAGFAAIFRLLPVEELVGVPIELDTGALIAIVLICLPIVLLACAIQTFIASFTRTTKEAGTYLPFVGLIPALPGFALAFLPIKPELWTMLIPTFGQQILINQFLRAEPVAASNIIISALITLIVVIVIIWGAVRLYEHERMILGR